jgi:hypothetical protein
MMIWAFSNSIENTHLESKIAKLQLEITLGQDDLKICQKEKYNNFNTVCKYAVDSTCTFALCSETPIETMQERICTFKEEEE